MRTPLFASLLLFFFIAGCAAPTASTPAPTEVTVTFVLSPIPTPIPSATATQEATATPEYPIIFDKPEDILTPEKLPVVDMADVLSGKHAEMVLEMYTKGLIRQISPAAKPYPFQWGNTFTDSRGKGQPMSIFMRADEKLFYEQNPPYSFVLFQSESQGEKVVLVETIWLNKDGTVSVMPQTIPFSWFPKWQNSLKETLTGIAPTPIFYKDEQACVATSVTSQENCRWQMSVQEEWLKLMQAWVKSGNMPPGFSRYPLQMGGGTTTYFTE